MFNGLRSEDTVSGFIAAGSDLHFVSHPLSQRSLAILKLILELHEHGQHNYQLTLHLN